jgi:hypothetical protein
LLEVALLTGHVLADDLKYFLSEWVCLLQTRKVGLKKIEGDAEHRFGGLVINRHLDCPRTSAYVWNFAALESIKNHSLAQLHKVVHQKRLLSGEHAFLYCDLCVL